MTPPTLLNILLVCCFSLTVLEKQVKAGICWSNKNCSTLLQSNVTARKCCMQGGVAYTDHDANNVNGEIFRILIDGSPTSTCQVFEEPGPEMKNEVCEGIVCPRHKECRPSRSCPEEGSMNPQCRLICPPKCTEEDFNSGPVCGTMNSSGSSVRMTFINHCEMLQRSCLNNTEITVAFYGQCKNSCDRVLCPDNKDCVTDQHNIPHCVRCDHLNCKDDVNVCGTDGNTYRNRCALRRKACKSGKTILVAYKGACLNNPTCASLTCPDGKVCLQDLDNKPRCIRCQCKKRHRALRDVCATDGMTYESECVMIRKSCNTGVFLTKKHLGKCKGENVQRVTAAPTVPRKDEPTTERLESLLNAIVRMRMMGGIGEPGDKDGGSLRTGSARSLYKLILQDWKERLMGGDR